MQKTYASSGLPVTLADLANAHAEIVASMLTIPDAALDWEPGGGDWSLKQTI